MTVHCPNCGKPVRQGAKYCGSCRIELPAGFSVIPAAQPVRSTAAPLPAGETACPRCGAVPRQGARFCTNCGSPIQAPDNPPAMPPQNIPSNSDRAKGQDLPADRTARTARPARARRRRAGMLVIAVGLLACCAFGTAAALTQNLWRAQVEAILGARAAKTPPPSAAPTALPTGTSTASDVVTAPAALESTVASATPVTETPAPVLRTPAPTTAEPLKQKANGTPRVPAVEPPVLLETPDLKIINLEP